MNMVSIAKELSFFLPDLPGSLFHACNILGEAKIDIRGLTTSDLSDYALVRMVVEEPQKATRALEEHGLMVSQNEVLLIEGSNRPGGIAGILKCLTDARTNIEYTYTSSSASASRGLIILRVNPIKQAYKAIDTWYSSHKPSRKPQASKSKS